ncbi:amidohydrolase [Candidatus Halobonum tyrrellensis]|uniref:Amidohydrolase n=1 Tax=Candidatus Halobonum tyrrellensis G22 TaxID=1324957 RepID=V4GSQ4_9EURY|nr:amidohydrolase [Candidatus Halobonum tyrrellensis]ESP88126.1 amidohydrolase [Candidatus Halobonum tyrrellensis G22]
MPDDTTGGAKARLFDAVERRRDRLTDLSRRIWEEPEVALRETESARRLREALREEGFEVETGVGGMETAFVARYGEGDPTVATMGEFDALPGMSQTATAERDPREPGAPGHGCGHNLFGVGSLGGALAVRDAIERGDCGGTVVYFGTPAEEAGGGKVYMVRDGAFDGVDAVVSWHPGWYNAPGKGSCLAVDAYEVAFEGETSHAAAAPEAGRSALDGVHLLNTGIEFMREHVPEAARIHYVVSEGGGAANVVPAAATTECLVRAPDRAQVERIGGWVRDIAEGAALMSRTDVEVTKTSAMYGVLPNHALADRIRANMDQVHRAGGISLSDDQREFSADLRASLGDVSLGRLPAEYHDEVRNRAMYTEPLDAPDEGTTGSYSTDSGDVSWTVPLGRFTAATWPVGTPAHSWQAVAAGRDLGTEGALFAAKTIAATLYDLLVDGELRTAARAEFDDRTGERGYDCGLPADANPYELVSR